MKKEQTTVYETLFAHYDFNNDFPQLLLLALPSDIQNSLAQYLIFKNRETDEELIARTKEITYGTIEHNSIPMHSGILSLCKKLYVPFITQKKALKIIHKDKKIIQCLYTYKHCRAWRDSTLFSCSSDKTKIIISRMLAHKSYESDQSKVLIFDLISKKVWKQFFGLPPSYPSFIHMINSDIYKAIAVSSCGTRFARIYRAHNNLAQHYLELKNIVPNKAPQIKELGLPFASIKSMAFNKQGTRLIIHSDNDHILIPIGTQKEHEAKSIKRMADYLAEKGVCKNLAALKDNNQA